MQELYELQADVCEVFSNSKRLEIINHLKERELSAGELIEKTGLSRPTSPSIWVSSGPRGSS